VCALQNSAKVLHYCNHSGRECLVCFIPQSCLLVAALVEKEWATGRRVAAPRAWTAVCVSAGEPGIHTGSRPCDHFARFPEEELIRFPVRQCRVCGPPRRGKGDRDEGTVHVRLLLPRRHGLLEQLDISAQNLEYHRLPAVQCKALGGAQLEESGQEGGQVGAVARLELSAGGVFEHRMLYLLGAEQFQRSGENHAYEEFTETVIDIL